MKFRNGFVSNSSSSSFIVSVRQIFDKENLITNKEIKILQKYGFVWTHCWYSDQVPEDKLYKGKTDYHALGYHVDCNQDEVIAFLVKNNIPFAATLHYGHRSAFFQRNSKKVLIIRNPGREFEMYGYGNTDDKEILKQLQKECQKPKYNFEKVISEKPIKEYLEETNEI
jgi:hypothetical protein